MIVRNEASIIARCLRAVRGIVTTWVIVDTGSTDGTQDIVRSELSDIPGHLHERPWKNFGHNRTEALRLAADKADYTLILDADEELFVPPGFVWPAMDLDSYQIKTELAGTVYYRVQLLCSALNWRYEGVLHEYPACDGSRSQGRIEGLLNRPRTDGARSKDPEKYKKDAAVLEQALHSDPGNARYVFYLAQSWRDAGELDKALAAYRRRADMGGWDEEVWFSLFQVARLSERLRLPQATVANAYLTAYQARPTRAESLCELARYYRLAGQFALAFLFASAAAQIPMGSDILFLDPSAYEWRTLDEYAIAAYYLGKYREGLEANQRLLASGRVPDGERQRITQNLAFCHERLPATVDVAAARFTIGYIDHDADVHARHLGPSLRALAGKFETLTTTSQQCPAANYNSMIARCTTPYLILTHQDVTLPANLLTRIEATIARVPDFGALGMTGVDARGGRIYACEDTVAEVDTLDSCFIVIRTALGVRFDQATFNELHYYVEDYCAQVNRQHGLKCYTILATSSHGGTPLPGPEPQSTAWRHHGQTSLQRGACWGSWHHYHQLLLQKWPGIRTPRAAG